MALYGMCHVVSCTKYPCSCTPFLYSCHRTTSFHKLDHHLKEGHHSIFPVACRRPIDNSHASQILTTFVLELGTSFPPYSSTLTLNHTCPPRPAGYGINTEHCPRLIGSCLDLASPSRGGTCGSLHMQLVCRRTLPLAGNACTVIKTTLLIHRETGGWGSAAPALHSAPCRPRLQRLQHALRTSQQLPPSCAAHISPSTGMSFWSFDRLILSTLY